jgi:hypothetical protein
MKVALLLAGGLVALAALLLMILAALPLVPFETAIVAAFDGSPDLGPDAPHSIECSGFECAEVVPHLPRVSAVSCTQPLVGRPLRIAAFGACCSATFGDLGTTEVHIFRQDSRFEIVLTEPRMRRVIRELDEQAGSGS